MADRERLAHVPECFPARFETLREEHLPQLRALCAEDEEIWQIYPVNMMSGEGFDDAMRQFHEGDWVMLAIIDARTGKVAGMSNYIGINTAFPGDLGILEIGGTFVSMALRGTGFNRAMKQAMIDHAFDCGFHKVVFHVDERNTRSKAAVTKLGAVYEGTRRKDKITWTGHVRDTACFSILREEWEERQASAG